MNQSPTLHSVSKPASEELSRRGLLIGGGVAVAAAMGLGALKSAHAVKQPVFIAKNQRYDQGLVETIRNGLLATDIQAPLLKGKKVLLKPNLVEPMRERPHMTTHPAMIVAAAEVFRQWGAQVTVGEAPGHVRDTEMALYESGVGQALDAAGLTFADLNYQSVGWVKNGGGASPLQGIYFPQSVVEADLVVSMPKMKTHHWVGVTASMKNLYGVLPGIKYGWPKNVLHHAGIPQTVIDINATLPARIAIVDGIDCMEGDGPILGSKKTMGLVVVGSNLPAVDATIARMMGFDPKRIEYLSLASRKLGPLDDRKIEQRGERWQPLVDAFKILDQPHLRKMRPGKGPLVT